VEDDSYDGENDSMRGKPAGRGKASSKGQPVEDDSYDERSHHRSRKKSLALMALDYEYSSSSL
jgi:hypothetical protein